MDDTIADMRNLGITHATVVAYLALFLALGGTAFAATGGTFKLGQKNAASKVTTLTNAKGAALSLKSKSGAPPLTVGNSVKVPKLNADLVDGLSAEQLKGKVRVVTVEASYDPASAATVSDTAWCAPGEQVTGGGFLFANADTSVQVVLSQPIENSGYQGHETDDGWSVTAKKGTGVSGFRVYAMCLK